jgi:2-polyprenyl-3-methyl-5-hydroxy-6-metoxy-1,4-benzoquinol methylase
MQKCSHPQDCAEHLYSTTDYITRETFHVARCRQCAQVVTLPVPQDPGRYYPAGYYGSAGQRRFPAAMEWLQQKLYARRARFVLRHVKGRRASVLDVGCGRGGLLDAFRREGCDVIGTEFSDEACRYARSVLNLPVCIGSLEELRFPDEHFDVVLMWHVLEHISDPRSTVVELARILRPGGVLFIGVPNFASPEARFSKGGWFHLDAPRHLSHHTLDSLQAALNSAGIQTKEVSFFAPEYDCFSVVQSSLNALGLRKNLLYNLLRGGRAKLFASDRSVASIFITLLLAPMLGIISLPVTLLLGACGKGATLSLIAVKEMSGDSRGAGPKRSVEKGSSH